MKRTEPVGLLAFMGVFCCGVALFWSAPALAQPATDGGAVALGTRAGGDTIYWLTGNVWKNVDIADRKYDGRYMLRIENPPEGFGAGWYCDYDSYETAAVPALEEIPAKPDSAAGGQPRLPVAPWAGGAVNPPGNSPSGQLYEAARRGDVDTARQLLEQGADPNEGGALGRAAANGHLAVVELLLEHGGDPNEGGGGMGIRPLHWAAMTSQLEITKLLLASGADPHATDRTGQTASQKAKGANKAAIQALLDDAIRNPSPGQSRAKSAFVIDSLGSAAMWGDLTLARSYLDNGVDANTPYQGVTPILRAVGEGRKKMVELLIGRGAKVDCANSKGWTPLHIAVNLKDPVIFDMVLSRTSQVNAVGEHGITPLHLASNKRDLSMVGALLAKGADPNGVDQFGETPLRAAIRGGDLALLDLLLSRGADPNLPGKEGQTPLHYAAWGGGGNALRICERLIEAGAEADRKDDLKLTPLGYAKGETALYFYDRGCSRGIPNDNLMVGVSQPTGRDLIALAKRVLDTRIEKNYEELFRLSEDSLRATSEQIRANLMKVLVERESWRQLVAYQPESIFLRSSSAAPDRVYVMVTAVILESGQQNDETGQPVPLASAKRSVEVWHQLVFQNREGYWYYRSSSDGYRLDEERKSSTSR